MSILGAMEKYEKMLQNPKNRTSTTDQMVKMKQDSPYESVGIQDPETALVEEGISPEDRSMFASMDKGMQARWNNNEGGGENRRIDNLEKQIAEMQELLVTVMKTHMKLLDKI